MDTTWLIVIGVVVILAIIFILVTVKQARKEDLHGGRE